MPEEIFVKCVYCNKTFNVEWQGIELKKDETGVCGKEDCVERHQNNTRIENKSDDDKMEGY